MNLNNKYGPFSPQELDKMVEWLENNHINFELSKDQNIENKFTVNSPANMVAFTEFRTKTYLAQIFFIDVSFNSQEVMQAFEIKYIQKSEVIPIWINKITDQLTTEVKSESQQRKKRLWATVLIVFWLGYIVFSFFRAYHS